MEKNNKSRTMKIEYLREHIETVAVMGKNDEYDIVSTKNCKKGDTVWVLEKNGTFTKTKIYER